ncbi:MAG: hypothetical protein V7752_08060 [Halopseudomonas sp.]
MTRTVELRPGVRASYVVRRKLTLAPESIEYLQQHDALLSQLNLQCETLHGFNRLERNGNSLLLQYDAGNLQLDRLLEPLRLACIQPASNRWTRFRLSWYRYQDANIHDNSRSSDSSCCSQSPLRHR